MTRGIIILLCVAVYAGLCYVNLLVNRPRIEEDLTARTQMALRAQGTEVLDVSFDGRDGTVAIAGEPKDVGAALAATEAVWGVRVAQVSARKIRKPELKMERKGAELSLFGKVPRKSDADLFRDAVRKIFPSSPPAALAIEAPIVQRPYLPGLVPYLNLLHDAPADLTAELSNDTLVLSGILPDEASFAVTEGKARELLPNGVSLVFAVRLAERQTAAVAATRPVLVGPDPFQEALSALRLLFGFNSAEVLPQSAEDVERAVKLLKENPGRKVQVLGYTDAIGSDGYNVRLGGRRADGILALLVKQGVGADRLEPVARGKRDYVADNGTAENRQRNRRVQLVARPPGGGG